MNKQLILSIIFLMLFPGFLHCQETKPTIARNVISGEIANLIVTGDYTFNYERCLISNKKSQLFINVGYGGWYVFQGDLIISSSAIPISLNQVFGRGNNKMEFNAGVMFLPDKQWSPVLNEVRDPNYNRSKITPLFNFGYRYQKLSGGIVFRLYAGLTGLGVGLGYAF